MFGSPQGNPLLQIGASGIFLRQWRLDSQNRETIEKWEQEDRVDRADGAGWKIPELRADHGPMAIGNNGIPVKNPPISLETFSQWVGCCLLMAMPDLGTNPL